VRAQNFLLLEEKETLAVNCLVATQTKNQLAHELNYLKGEASDLTRKRPRVEDFSIPIEEYKKVVADWEKKYEQKRRDCETLKSSKANAE
jgi:hypothetical protein